MLEVRNLAFSYRSTPVLRDVSFVASPGEVVSVVGANGVGKTTLLRILATLILPDGGMILQDGVDAFARPLRYRRQLGYFSENPALYDDMTVKEYLRYRSALKGEPLKRIRRRVDEAVDMCRINPYSRSRIKSLSNGVRKRVALADALLLRPRLLLLDDILSGLDRELRSQMGEILSNAAAFSSVIITGHEFEDMAKWSTRFLVLRNGMISGSIPTTGVSVQQLCERVDSAIKGGVL